MQNTDEEAKTVIMNNLRKMNELMRRGRIDELEMFFHENIVLVKPEFAGRVEGREIILQSIKVFLSKAEFLRANETDFSIDIWEDTAVASHKYDMAWRIGGEEFSETGHSLFTFKKVNGNWSIIWRTLIPIKDN